MKVFYDESFKCYLSAPSSISPYIEVPEDFSLTKSTEIKVGTKQKADSEGNPLFLRDVYEIRTHEEIVGYTETIKPNVDGKPLDPVYIKVQKTDEEGNDIYYKVNDRGETEETTEVTDYPVMVEVHKTNSAGKKLYKNPVVQLVEERVKTGEEEVTIDTGRPVIVDILKEIEVSLLTDPQYFTVQEVLKSKYKYMTDKYGNNILYTEFLDLNNVESFNGNTGLGFVQLAPKSKLKFKTLSLDTECNAIDLLDFIGDSYIEISVGGRILKSAEVKLVNNIRQMTITLANNTSEYLTIHKLAIVASFKEQTQEEKLEARLTTIEENQARMQSVLDEMLLGGGI